MYHTTLSPLEHALNYHRAGLVPVPMRTDGTKAPAIEWRDYQRCQPSEVDIQTWFTQPMGIGLICGSISDNLLAIDFDFNAATNFNNKAKLTTRKAYGYLPTKPLKLPCITVWQSYPSQNSPTNSADEAKLKRQQGCRSSRSEQSPATRRFSKPSRNTSKKSTLFKPQLTPHFPFGSPDFGVRFAESP